MPIRQPIITVCGHVDCGKTTLLDFIRKTTLAKREAGGITQNIGATEVPKEIIEQICSKILKKAGIEVKIPGLLFIDTPGHEAFTNLRKRGGNIADLGVLIVDINEGFMPQTIEALEILKLYKTPFIVAANKIDRLSGWKSHPEETILDDIALQQKFTQDELDTKIYEIVGKLYEYGFESERFDRVTDATRQISIIPISARTGEGVPEVLMYATGLAQKYLGKQIEIDENAPGKGTILEAKEDKGLGKTIDVILYDGTIKAGDIIVVSGIEGPFETKVRSILKTKPLEEIRDPKEKFKVVNKASAAAGIKIAAPGLENALAGAPVYVVREKEKIKQVMKEIEAEIEQINIKTEKAGVIVKADALGSVEAIAKMLEAKEIPIHSAGVGVVSKTDVMEAAGIKKQDRYLGVIFAFNTMVDDATKEEAKKEGVKIFESGVVYTILEEYEEWVQKEKEVAKRELLNNYVLPGKIQIIPGYVFRASKPAIVGVKVIEGVLKPDYPLMNEKGEIVGRVKSIQSEGESLKQINKDEEAAIAIIGPTIGRQVEEGEILYTAIPKEHRIQLRKKYAQYLKTSELELLKEIGEISKEI